MTLILNASAVPNAQNLTGLHNPNSLQITTLHVTGFCNKEQVN